MIYELAKLWRNRVKAEATKGEELKITGQSSRQGTVVPKFDRGPGIALQILTKGQLSILKSSRGTESLRQYPEV